MAESVDLSEIVSPSTIASEQPRQKYKLFEITFALSLGVDPTQRGHNKHLMPVATDGLFDLPENFELYLGNAEYENVPFFRDLSTGRALWTHPREEQIRARLQRAAAEQGLELADEINKTSLPMEERRGSPSLAGAILSPRGKASSVSFGESSWLTADNLKSNVPGLSISVKLNRATPRGRPKTPMSARSSASDESYVSYGSTESFSSYAPSSRRTARDDSGLFPRSPSRKHRPQSFRAVSAGARIPEIHLSNFPHIESASESRIPSQPSSPLSFREIFDYRGQLASSLDEEPEEEKAAKKSPPRTDAPSLPMLKSSLLKNNFSDLSTINSQEDDEASHASEGNLLNAIGAISVHSSLDEIPEKPARPPQRGAVGLVKRPAGPSVIGGPSIAAGANIKNKPSTRPSVAPTPEPAVKRAPSREGRKSATPVKAPAPIARKPRAPVPRFVKKGETKKKVAPAPLKSPAKPPVDVEPLPALDLAAPTEPQQMPAPPMVPVMEPEDSGERPLSPSNESLSSVESELFVPLSTRHAFNLIHSAKGARPTPSFDPIPRRAVSSAPSTCKDPTAVSPFAPLPGHLEELERARMATEDVNLSLKMDQAEKEPEQGQEPEGKGKRVKSRHKRRRTVQALAAATGNKFASPPRTKSSPPPARKVLGSSQVAAPVKKSPAPADVKKVKKAPKKVIATPVAPPSPGPLIVVIPSVPTTASEVGDDQDSARSLAADEAFSDFIQPPADPAPSEPEPSPPLPEPVEEESQPIDKDESPDLVAPLSPIVTRSQVTFIDERGPAEREEAPPKNKSLSRSMPSLLPVQRTKISARGGVKSSPPRVKKVAPPPPPQSVMVMKQPALAPAPPRDEDERPPTLSLPSIEAGPGAVTRQGFGSKRRSDKASLIQKLRSKAALSPVREKTQTPGESFSPVKDLGPWLTITACDSLYHAKLIKRKVVKKVQKMQKTMFSEKSGIPSALRLDILQFAYSGGQVENLVRLRLEDPTAGLGPQTLAEDPTSGGSVVRWIVETNSLFVLKSFDLLDSDLDYELIERTTDKNKGLYKLMMRRLNDGTMASSASMK